jgi:hypothetical protein
MGPVLPLSLFGIGFLAGRSARCNRWLEQLARQRQIISRLLADLLLLSIGLKGGLGITQSLHSEGLMPFSVAILMVVGILHGALLPLWASGAAARWLRWPLADAALLAGYYGSVSVMTFASAGLFLDQLGVPCHPGMTVLLVAMEFPALVVALWRTQQRSAVRLPWGHLLASHRILWMLLGAMAVGCVGSFVGLSTTLQLGLKAVPCIMGAFLIDQGLRIASAMQQGKGLSRRLLLWAIIMPSLQGLLGCGVAAAVGATPGDGLLFAVLLSSASYLAAPAFFAQCRPSAVLPACTTASLCITFPWNLLVTLPVIWQLIAWWQRAH